MLAESCPRSPFLHLQISPSHHLIPSWTSNRTEMSKSLATPILHFAQDAQVNNPLLSTCKLIGRSMFLFLGLFRHFCKQGFQLWFVFFFFSLPNYYVYREAAYSEVPRLKATHIKLQPIQSKTERVMQGCVPRKSGDRSGHTKAPVPSPEGREGHKEPATEAKAPSSPCTPRVKQRALHTRSRQGTHSSL